MLDVKSCYAIGNLVEKLSTLGKDELDSKMYKELVGYAGQSEDYIKFCLEKLIQQLERKHSEIRLGAFLVIEELFRKSECFRELLLDDFHHFLELTVESNPAKLLPPPLDASKKLKQRVLQAIQKWYTSFGREHKRITLSYNFIKTNLKIDFNDALKRTEAELQKEAVEKRRASKFLANKLDALKVEIEDNVDEISRVVTEMNNCFCLLVPKPEDLFSSGPEAGDNCSEVGSSVDLREHGLSAANAVIPVNFNAESKIRKTADNAAIVENLRDLYVILKNRFFPLVKKWISISSKADDSTYFRRVMDLKEMIQSEMGRYEELNINPLLVVSDMQGETNKNEDCDSESESESDFEEVPEKDGYEENAFAPPVNACSSSEARKTISSPANKGNNPKLSTWSLWNDIDNNANDPTSIQATLTKLKTNNLKNQVCSLAKNDLKDVTSRSAYKSPSVYSAEGLNKCLNAQEERKSKLLKVAPKLPFDIDLYHWEEESLQAPSVELGISDGHRFWQPSDREGETVEAPDGVASLRTRVIEFSGKFEPVKWSCRAPLLSGKLCPRRDRYKCPLHGKIIARDNMGNPTKPEDIAELAIQKEKEESEKPPDWQDPEFLKDIQAATGMDLTVRPPKRGKKKKTFAEVYPHLTDIDKKKNNPRNRLEKKVFNRGSIKRVAETMDSINYKKFKDKYGDQWNYSMNE